MWIDLFDPGAVPLWAAFLAGVVSMVGLIIAKEQRVSDFRQEWINGVRGEIASLIGTVNAINEWLWSIEELKAEAGRVGEAQREGAPAGLVDAGQIEEAQAEAVPGRPIDAGLMGKAPAKAAPPGPADAYEVVHPDVLRMEEALAMIELRLNPYEERAEPVLEKAEAVVSMLRFYKPVDRTELKDAEKELLKESTKYLKCEWEVVKKGELRHRVAVWITTGLATVGIVVFLYALAGWIWGQLDKGTVETGVTPVEEVPAAVNVAGARVAPDASEPRAGAAEPRPGPAGVEASVLGEATPQSTPSAPTAEAASLRAPAASEAGAEMEDG